MRHHLLLVVLGCMASGCGDPADRYQGDGPPPPATEPPASDAPYASGGRLRAHVWKGDDGPDVYIDWSDDQLGAMCSFARVDGAAMRCVPNAEVPPNVFLDAHCGEPAAVLQPGQSESAYVRQAQPSCPGEWPSVGVLALGDERPASTPLYGHDESGACVAIASPGGRIFAATKADAWAFISAHLESEPRGAFDVEVIVGEDGSRQLGWVIDRARHAACMPLAALGDTEARCFPSDAA
jgi:hypothetical protein